MEEKIIVGEQDIKVDLIDSFPNHPYHVFDDTDMSELVASIQANGLLSPIIVFRFSVLLRGQKMMLSSL